MKKLFPLVIICLLIPAGTSRAEDPVRLKFGIHESTQSNVMVGAYIPWIENMNKAAQGSVQIEFTRAEPWAAIQEHI